MKKLATDLNEFDMIKMSLASPEQIFEWSYGEVTKPETINYRTQRSERSGLFDEKIFGPDKDYECYCGKYRGIRYKGIICEKCGVEITRSIVRRERMGHIELASPVSHIWFLKSTPSRIGLIMGIPAGDVEKVVYFMGYIIVSVSEDERARILKDLDSEYRAKSKSMKEEKDRELIKERLLNTKREIEGVQVGRVIDEVEFHNYSLKYGTLFEAGIGAEAIFDIFKKVDLKILEEKLVQDSSRAGVVELAKINKRLSTIRYMINSGTRPEWMFLTRIPVIPPALRPMVPLDGGRYATADVNDLYRRVINRNNRLKKLKEINAPDVILRNEKRILQEAVDALIDNSIRHGSSVVSSATQAQRRPLKSLADNLKGKRGIFRQNLLGKRVDYSGRSVIVVGPELKLDQCGLPKHMALELFKPFVISGLLRKELAFNIRGANRLIEDSIPEVWAILEEVIDGKYVLLNRAPTLHRLGIQAFKPVLIEGNAIQVHPLVCSAFNADFDGDQMAVHVPLSEEAQLEAKEIMASDKNILKPGSGDSIISAKMMDILLGCYWMTKTVEGEKGEGKIFPTPNIAITAYDFDEVDFRSKIGVLSTETEKYKQFNGGIFETTVGRLLFNSALPGDYPYVNTEIDRKKMSSLIEDLTEKYGIAEIPSIVDKIKNFGFKYATISGITWGIDDVVIPPGKPQVLEKAEKESLLVISQYNEGLISEDERIRKNTEVWFNAKNEIEKLIPATLDKNGSVHDLVYSGTRGSFSQITQMAGMKGLITNTAGETIEFPIRSCMKEGLTPIEYFITTHGSRKGLSDTALNTAKAGYLTRRLFDVAQDTVIVEEDCFTKDGIIFSKENKDELEASLSKNIKGRFVAEDIKDDKGEVLFARNTHLNKFDALLLENNSAIKEVNVRSPLSCKTLRGICIKCYGTDIGKNRIVDLGEAVGTVAAQAIGEPGTQLTMRTFHAGGIASIGGDITQGLPRVEEVFEKRAPKSPSAISHVDGIISEIRISNREKVVVVSPHAIEHKTKTNSEYSVSLSRMIFVKEGDEVKKGDVMTDGSSDIDELFKYAGKEKTEKYIIREISKLYELQGESVSRKHIEVIVRQMYSRRKIKDPGNTRFTKGDVVEISQLTEENKKVLSNGGEEAKSDHMVMGISDVSLTRDSFLSAASFQHTTRVLIASALKGNIDRLVGLKENVIIGRIIPAGTGYAGSNNQKMIDRLHGME